MRQARTVITGKTGEDTAARYLHHLGYAVLGSNVRLGRDEVDILARDPMDGTLVFAEVKSRSRGHGEYRPDLDLTHRKRRAMSRAARRWVADHAYDGGYRMDLLCVAEGMVTEHWREIEWTE